MIFKKKSAYISDHHFTQIFYKMKGSEKKVYKKFVPDIRYNPRDHYTALSVILVQCTCSYSLHYMIRIKIRLSLSRPHFQKHDETTKIVYNGTEYDKMNNETFFQISSRCFWPGSPLTRNVRQTM